jgi:uncharacterized protein YjbI with pentapeptide repeats
VGRASGYQCPCSTPALAASGTCSGLSYAGCNLAGVNFSGGNLAGADFSGANLQGANFTGADLEGANLSTVNMQSATLANADLSGANLQSANMQGVNAPNTNFNNADLSNAHLQHGVHRCQRHPHRDQAPASGRLLQWNSVDGRSNRELHLYECQWEFRRLLRVHELRTRHQLSHRVDELNHSVGPERRPDGDLR